MSRRRNREIKDIVIGRTKLALAEGGAKLLQGGHWRSGEPAKTRMGHWFCWVPVQCAAAGTEISDTLMLIYPLTSHALL